MNKETKATNSEPGSPVVKMQRYPMTRTIEAIAESADFGPAYDGKDYITLTFRVPKDQPAIPGIWELTPRCPGSLDWAVTKDMDKAEAREERRLND